jgi:ParB family chromosome partitioning protein
MRKKALGRGIEALISQTEKDLLKEGFMLIRLRDIKPNPYQPRARIQEADVEDLIASIKEKGVLEPVIVKKQQDHFILAAGERRFRAAQYAGLSEIPAVIKDLTDQELLEIGLIENLHRQDLNPLEEATAYDQLHRKFGLTHEEIARVTSRNRSTITNTLRILSLPEKVKDYLRRSLLNEGHARALLSLESELKIVQVAERIVRDGLSVRAAENFIRKMFKRPAIRPIPEKEPNLLILEDELSKILRTKVTIAWKKNHGSITIECLSLEDFNRVYDVLKRGRRI